MRILLFNINVHEERKSFVILFLSPTWITVTEFMRIHFIIDEAYSFENVH